jgi:hypothetical protein
MVQHDCTYNSLADKFAVLKMYPLKRAPAGWVGILKRTLFFCPRRNLDPPTSGERRGKMKPGSFVLLVTENK